MWTKQVFRACVPWGTVAKNQYNEVWKSETCRGGGKGKVLVLGGLTRRTSKNKPHFSLLRAAPKRVPRCVLTITTADASAAEETKGVVGAFSRIRLYGL